VTSDFTTGSNEATIYGLQRMMQKYGPRGCGEWAQTAEAAAARVRMKTTPGHEAAADEANKGRPRRSSVAANAGPVGSPKDKDKTKAWPMVCPRCLRGELPNFPYVSVGELNKHIGCGGVTMEATKGSKKSSCKSSNSSGSSEKSGGFDSGSDEDDPALCELGAPSAQAGLELAEDMILSWATSALADSVILCKDERGAYFRWLARIVLYDFHDEYEDLKEVAKADPRGDPSKRPESREAAAPASRGPDGPRRMSFASALSAAIPRFTDEQAQERPGTEGGRKGSQAEFAGAVQAGHLPASQDIGDVAIMAVQAKKANQAAARRRADEFEQVAEAERDAALTLPDSHLACMRVDLGVTTSSKNEEGDQGRTAGLEELHEMFHNHVEQQQSRRKEREAKIMKELRSLGTAEPELRILEKGFQAAAEAPPNPSGVLLIGGAAQAAQRILIPNPGARKAVERGIEQADDEELQRALASLRKNSSNGPSSGVVPAAAAEVQRVAQEIREGSSTNASHCYGRAGYEDEAKKSRVAVALRLLEHQLFHAPAEEGGTGAEEDAISRVVPLLLSKQNAHRLLKQAQWEEEMQAQAKLAENKEGAIVERRKARVQEHKVTRDTPESTDSEPDGARSDRADSGASNRCKKSSDSKMLAGLQRGPGPPSSPSSRSPTPSRSKPRTPVSQMPETPGAQPIVSDAGQQLLEVHTNLHDWHPSVQRLFSSVAKRGESVRFTTRGAGFQRRGGSRVTMSRSASDPVVSPLPFVQEHASPQRGGHFMLNRQGRKVKKDLVLVEGWRAKMATTPDVTSYGHSAFPRVERES